MGFPVIPCIARNIVKKLTTDLMKEKNLSQGVQLVITGVGDNAKVVSEIT